MEFTKIHDCVQETKYFSDPMHDLYNINIAFFFINLFIYLITISVQSNIQFYYDIESLNKQNYTIICIVYIIFVSKILEHYRLFEGVALLLSCASLMQVCLMASFQFWSLRITRDIPLQNHTLQTIDYALMLPGWPKVFEYALHFNLYKIANFFYYLGAAAGLIPLFIFSQRQRLWGRLQIYILSIFFSLFITIVCSALFPATSQCTVGAGIATDPLIFQIRESDSLYLSLKNMDGLVMFPSYHAVIAIFSMWALWPVPGLRWISIIVNTAILTSTPLIGCHYFIDIFGGIVVAIASIALSKWFLRKNSTACPS
jgi:hypothetical protein